MMPNTPNTNTGHGHAWVRPDGFKARCGGPKLCRFCAVDAIAMLAAAPTPPAEAGVSYLMSRYVLDAQWERKMMPNKENGTEAAAPRATNAPAWRTTAPQVCEPFTLDPAVAEGWRQAGWDVTEYAPRASVAPVGADYQAIVDDVDDSDYQDGYDAGYDAGRRETAAQMGPAAPAHPDDAAVDRTYDLIEHLRRQRAWSKKTFGPGSRIGGVLDHIRKELVEIESDPTDVVEWIDVAMLAFDGAWRAGHAPEVIASALAGKLAKNEARVWPDWRTMPADKAIEHDRRADGATPEGGA